MDIEDQDLLDRVRRLRNDPLEFLKGVRTLDPVDKKKPIKDFPVHREYLRLYVRVWEKKRLLLVPKSRRMSMSWTNIALATWDCIFHPGRNWAFVSKKEIDSDELVKRASFIVENLNHDIVPKDVIPRHETVFCKLAFPEIHSNIQGYASGADQLRQFTFSGILGDEMAFWPNAEEMFSASFPTIEGKEGEEGGRFVGISSPAPGFFQRLVFDKLDEPDEEMIDGGIDE